VLVGNPGEQAWSVTRFKKKEIVVDTSVYTGQTSFLEQVLLHEIAHAICDPQVYHGPQWKKVASDLGMKPEFLRSGTD
jgi:predicted metal-dependent hydrolase